MYNNKRKALLHFGCNTRQGKKRHLTGIFGFGGTHSLAMYFFCSYFALMNASSDLSKLRNTKHWSELAEPEMSFLLAHLNSGTRNLTETSPINLLPLETTHLFNCSRGSAN